jgi:hypothetical protein
LKSLHSPAGGDGGAGLLDALDEMQRKLRDEFDDKLKLLSVQDVLARVIALEEESREKDTDL